MNNRTSSNPKCPLMCIFDFAICEPSWICVPCIGRTDSMAFGLILELGFGRIRYFALGYCWIDYWAFAHVCDELGARAHTHFKNGYPRSSDFSRPRITDIKVFKKIFETTDFRRSNGAGGWMSDSCLSLTLFLFCTSSEASGLHDLRVLLS